MIHDRIIVGLTDASLAEILQLNPELTLETAITKTQQSEMVKKQQAVLRADIPYVDGIHKRKPSKDKDPQRVNRNNVLGVEKFLHMPDKIALQKTLYVINVKRKDIFNLSVYLKKQLT